MSYNVDYEGGLTFSHSLTTLEHAYLVSLLEHEPCRHLEIEGLNCIRPSEPYRGMEEGYQHIINEMRKEVPHFELEGEVLAHGEDGLNWRIIVKDNVVVAKDQVPIDKDVYEALMTYHKSMTQHGVAGTGVLQSTLAEAYPITMGE
jgi:hypothetical protein